MSTKVEDKLMQLEYLCDAWHEIWVCDTASLELAQKCIEKAIVSISREMVEAYRAGFREEKSSEA